jgi:hypothetical protein
MILALVLACGAPADSDTNDTIEGYTPPDVYGGTAEATFIVDFDEASEARGLSDCTYHRTWSNGAEIRHSPWLCKECEAILRFDAGVDDGLDCFHVANNGHDPAPIEFLGWSQDGLWRTNSEVSALIPSGVLTRDDASLAWTNEADFDFVDDAGAEHTGTYHVTGSAVLAASDADPMAGLVPPDSYACGWSRSDADPWEGDYDIAVGDVIPDGVFMDACGEPVRLHDLLGTWLVIDVSASDCAACVHFAADTRDGIAALAAEQIDVRTITFFEPYGAATRAATPRELASWADPYHNPDPVLADRGFGQFVLNTANTDYTDFYYPTMLVVAPDGTIVDATSGYYDWDVIGDLIRANQ